MNENKNNIKDMLLYILKIIKINVLSLLIVPIFVGFNALLLVGSIVLSLFNEMVFQAGVLLFIITFFCSFEDLTIMFYSFNFFNIIYILIGLAIFYKVTDFLFEILDLTIVRVFQSFFSSLGFAIIDGMREIIILLDEDRESLIIKNNKKFVVLLLTPVYSFLRIVMRAYAYIFADFFYYANFITLTAIIGSMAYSLIKTSLVLGINVFSIIPAMGLFHIIYFLVIAMLVGTILFTFMFNVALISEISLSLLDGISGFNIDGSFKENDDYEYEYDCNDFSENFTEYSSSKSEEDSTTEQKQKDVKFNRKTINKAHKELIPLIEELKSLEKWNEIYMLTEDKSFGIDIQKYNSYICSAGEFFGHVSDGKDVKHLQIKDFNKFFVTINIANNLLKNIKSKYEDLKELAEKIIKVHSIFNECETSDALKKTYRAASKIYHPDTAETGDDVMFKILSTEYEKRKAQYS